MAVAILAEWWSEETSANGPESISTGYFHACVVTAEGGAKCWGNNDYGQLGNGTTVTSTTPVDVSGLTAGVTSIAAAVTHTCALTSSGDVKCWGRNDYGQFGDGTTNARSTPVDVIGLPGAIISVKTGDDYTCALTTGGAVKCWGNNSAGQLGNGTTIHSAIPVDVIGLESGIVSISAGNDYACAVTVDGGLKCWGQNTHGQIGDGTTTDSSAPVDVIGMESGVTAISAGYLTTCAIATGGGVKCWGWNGSGQLGDGSFVDSTTPVDVVGLSGSGSLVSAAYQHSCAMTMSGTVECWGHNANGELGDGTNYDSTTPVSVVGLQSGVSTISAGSYTTCAVRMRGARCWGGGQDGQLGNGAFVNSNIPVDVFGLGPDIDGDGCSNGNEYGPNEQLGGLRNPKNPWDYFNPTHDGENRIDDVLAVVGAYFQDDGDGNPGLPPYVAGYNPDTDRTALGPNAWNLGPPNGQQRIDDILAIIKQYFHDCS